jgi:hypothetical protein
MLTDQDGGDVGPRQSGDWRVRIGSLFLIAIAGGLGINLLTIKVGYRGFAISAALGGILLGAARLRRFPQEAPLVVVSSWVALVLASVCAILAVITPLPWSGYAVLGAALFTFGAVVIPLDRYQAVRALGGIACIGIGVSLIGDGVGLLSLDPLVLIILFLANLAGALIVVAAAVIGIGISLIGAGLALLLRRTTLIGVACVGLGVSIIGAGIASLSINKYTVLAAWLIATGVVAAIGAGVAFRFARDTLLGVASVGLGVSLISAGVAILLIPARYSSVAFVGLGVSLISSGVIAIGAGVAFLRARRKLIAVAAVGFGVSLISAGVAAQFLEFPAMAVWLVAPGVVAIGAGVAFLRARRRLIAVATVGFAVSLIGAGVAALLIQDSLIWILVIVINDRVVVALGSGVAVGTWIAIGPGVTALAAGVALPPDRGTLMGVAGICLGITLIGAGVAAGLDGTALFAVWLIATGVSLLGLAFARLRDKYVLTAAAAIGFGISLTVLAIEFFLGGEQLGGAATIGAELAAIGAGIAIYPSKAELRNRLSNWWTAWTRAPGEPPQR